jgi:hypothetical protein
MHSLTLVVRRMTVSFRAAKTARNLTDARCIYSYLKAQIALERSFGALRQPQDDSDGSALATEIVIAGFILGGSAGDDSLILRGIGPSLSQFGVPDALPNPTLELRDSNGALLNANDDWQDDPNQAALITAAGLAPTNQLESGIAATLAPGQYTVLLAGVNNNVGVGLVEVYDLAVP